MDVSGQLSASDSGLLSFRMYLLFMASVATRHPRLDICDERMAAGP